jgi:hypothetical protein
LGAKGLEWSGADRKEGGEVGGVVGERLVEPQTLEAGEALENVDVR